MCLCVCVPLRLSLLKDEILHGNASYRNVQGLTLQVRGVYRGMDIISEINIQGVDIICM